MMMVMEDIGLFYWGFLIVDFVTLCRDGSQDTVWIGFSSFNSIRSKNRGSYLYTFSWENYRRSDGIGYAFVVVTAKPRSRVVPSSGALLCDPDYRRWCGR